MRKRRRWAKPRYGRKSRTYRRPASTRPISFNKIEIIAGGAFFLAILFAFCTIRPFFTPHQHTPTATPKPSYSDVPTADPLTPTPTVYISPTPTTEPRLVLSPVTNDDTDDDKKVIKYGDKGKDVSALQKRLAELGYLSFSDVDGVFGDKTRDAMLAFQKAAKLPQTGECTHDDYLKLVAANAPSAPQNSNGKGPTYVYITPTGSKYHNTWCPTLQRDAVAVKKVTEEWAISHGYEKCRAKGDW